VRARSGLVCALVGAAALERGVEARRRGAAVAGDQVGHPRHRDWRERLGLPQRRPRHADGWLEGFLHRSYAGE